MTYTLHEAVCPNGYEPAEDIPFTVSLDGSIDDVNMIDAKTSEPHTPQTGDGFSMLIFIIAGMALITGLVAVTSRKRNK